MYRVVNTSQLLAKRTTYMYSCTLPYWQATLLASSLEEKAFRKNIWLIYCNIKHLPETFLTTLIIARGLCIKRTHIKRQPFNLLRGPKLGSINFLPTFTVKGICFQWTPIFSGCQHHN